MNQTTIDAGRFDLAQIAARLPVTATTLLVDHYLTNREAASARVFRVYKPTPPHYHATCDEYLYVFSFEKMKAVARARAAEDPERPCRLPLN